LVVALREARRLLTEQYLERVIIVAADSYTDRPSLEWIDGQRRLKQPLQPVGLMPGQAGACLQVEAKGVALARGAPQTIQVGGASRAIPPGGRSRAPELGRALAESILQVLHAAEEPPPFRGSLVVDLNGEEWKAVAWGHAQVHLVRHVDFEQCRLRSPAESLGELGAASAAVGAGIAISDLLQGDDADVGAIVCSLSDAGEVGAVLFQRIREF